ncbi:MAG: undecaprenyldiphospho-muramoylpentapeptide beta-N-acetylglucosaminyltransferase [Candidatus Solibacter usitatus]|nr:undecaprenyldiphospho-muramoylpentapeptide beta-N-acetylglucosaminyltransferase [Candidatus Solibacter usitatus]
MAVFLMTGGGTGGHVIPAIAVARELRRRGHSPFFIGTRQGLESRLVPKEGMPLEFIEIGGLKRVGMRQTVRTMWQLPAAILRSMRFIRTYKPVATFSMGGYVAGPVALASWAMRVPIVVMEPNAMPGFVNRRIGKIAKRALLTFVEAKQFFPEERVEMTGLPVRPEFFTLPVKERGGELTVLVTGGSRGSHRINEAGRLSWTMFQTRAVRWIHQAGSDDHGYLRDAFTAMGMRGEVVPFIDDMPRAYAQSDLVICRAGAGTVSELAAAGKPSILIPFPFAADQHQLRNAEAMSNGGAARLIRDAELTGTLLWKEILALADAPGMLEQMGARARSFARPGAAERAADILEEEAAADGRRKAG